MISLLFLANRLKQLFQLFVEIRSFVIIIITSTQNGPSPKEKGKKKERKKEKEKEKTFVQSQAPHKTTSENPERISSMPENQPESLGHWRIQTESIENLGSCIL
jgi:hypothetical protein